MAADSTYLSRELDKAEARLSKGNGKGAYRSLEHAFHNTHFAEAETEFDRLSDLLKHVGSLGDPRLATKAKNLLPEVEARRALFIRRPQTVSTESQYRTDLLESAGGG